MSYNMSPKLVSVLRNARSDASRRYTTQASIQEWISKTSKTEPSIHTDTLDRLRASHLLRTLPTRQHISPTALRDGDELGKGHSMIYFQPETMLKDLGKDGSSTVCLLSPLRSSPGASCSSPPLLMVTADSPTDGCSHRFRG